MKTSEVLHKAADLIESEGLGHGPNSWRGDGGYCTEGAIAAAHGDMRYYSATGKIRQAQLSAECAAYKAVQDYLNWHQPLWMWNDQYDYKESLGRLRTQEEVVATLRAAALIEEMHETVRPAVITKESA